MRPLPQSLHPRLWQSAAPSAALAPLLPVPARAPAATSAPPPFPTNSPDTALSLRRPGNTALVRQPFRRSIFGRSSVTERRMFDIVEQQRTKLLALAGYGVCRIKRMQAESVECLVALSV
jgi:hypothetical protein